MAKNSNEVAQMQTGVRMPAPDSAILSFVHCHAVNYAGLPIKPGGIVPVLEPDDEIMSNVNYSTA